MWSIIEAAGWPIWPIMVASVIALAIILERLVSLRAAVVVPRSLLEGTIAAWKRNGCDDPFIQQLAQSSPLGQVFAAGLRYATYSHELIKASIEEEGRVVAHQLGRFLTSLGTIASMAPLLGLLGTVIGMIELFGSQGPIGSNPQQLAHGISIALYNTAFGLIVAVPSMIFYRHFRARVDALLVEMESQAVKLLELLHDERNTQG